jgi:hypothetical protein
MKVLYADYEKGYTIIEFIGEWNDAINNDIMMLKREILELMIDNGINLLYTDRRKYIELPLIRRLLLRRVVSGCGRWLDSGYQLPRACD